MPLFLTLDKKTVEEEWGLRMWSRNNIGGFSHSTAGAGSKGWGSKAGCHVKNEDRVLKRMLNRLKMRVFTFLLWKLHFFIASCESIINRTKSNKISFVYFSLVLLLKNDENKSRPNWCKFCRFDFFFLLKIKPTEFFHPH